MTTKLYTKSGDTGTSQLIGSQRLPKHHPIFQHLGDLDELNSSIGIAIAHTTNETKQELQKIQHLLLTIGAIIAGSQKPKLTTKTIHWLEKHIDHYQSEFDDKWYQNFLLPGGTELAARLDLARAICRRTERSFSKLHQSKYLDQLESRSIRNWKNIPVFLNRLSDYLFALRCHINQKARQQETKFQPSPK